MIGCGIDWTLKKAFFTKNGVLIGQLNLIWLRSDFLTELFLSGFCFADLKGPLYPSVGLRTPGEVVKVNFGGSEFRFDIDHFTSVQKAQSVTRILEQPISSSYLNQHDEAALQALETLRASDQSEEDSLPLTCLDTSSTMSQIIASYLSYHGLIDTSTAFTAEREERQLAFSDLIPPSASTSSQQPEALASMLSRRRIMELIRAGQALNALEQIKLDFPSVIADQAVDESSLTFILMCQQFVEIILKVMELRSADSSEGQEMEVDEAESSEEAEKEKVKEDVAQEELKRLREAVLLGRQIFSMFAQSQEDVTPAMITLSSLLAYKDLSTAPEPTRALITEPVMQRESLAAKVNATLLSQSSSNQHTCFIHAYALLQ